MANADGVVKNRQFDRKNVSVKFNQAKFTLTILENNHNYDKLRLLIQGECNIDSED